MRARITITSDYSDQTEAKLAAGLMPVLNRWMFVEVNNSAQFFAESGHFYCHTQLLDTPHIIDDEPVLALLFFTIKLGAVEGEMNCYIGSDKNVQARESQHLHFMKEMAAKHKESSFIQID